MNIRKFMWRKELRKGQKIFGQRWGFGGTRLSVLRRMPRFGGGRKEGGGQEYERRSRREKGQVNGK
jgi:hypothetical protein